MDMTARLEKLSFSDAAAGAAAKACCCYAESFVFQFVCESTFSYWCEPKGCFFLTRCEFASLVLFFPFFGCACVCVCVVAWAAHEKFNTKVTIYRKFFESNVRHIKLLSKNEMTKIRLKYKWERMQHSRAWIAAVASDRVARWLESWTGAKYFIGKSRIYWMAVKTPNVWYADGDTSIPREREKHLNMKNILSPTS